MGPYIYFYFDKKRQKVIYVGKSNGRDKTYRTGSKVLKRYIRIYGYENFDKEIYNKFTDKYHKYLKCI